MTKNYIKFYPSITNPYRGWGNKTLQAGLSKIVTCMTNNDNFPTLQVVVIELGTATTVYTEAIGKAGNRDKVAIAARQTAREAAILLVIALGESVAQVCNGNLEMLLSSGFPLRKQPESTELEKPILIVTNGKNPGELVAKTPAQSAAGSYNFVLSLTQDSSIATWMTIANRRSRIVIKGLEPGKRYYIKVCAIGSKDSLYWSDTMQSPFVQGE